MHPRRRSLVGFLLASTAVVFAARGLTAEDSLYTRLGGQPAVKAVASQLVDRILQDNRVNRWFAHAASSPENTAAYKSKLSDFVCQATGGPCTYSGRDMVTAHKGRMVTSDAFDAVAQDLTEVLVALKVPEHEKRQLLDLVGTLKPSIVQP
jgi:hemoglobin